MKARAAVLLVGAVWLLSFLLWISPGVVRPDGAGYLVYLPSAWIDGDLLFFNEWERLRMIRDGVIQHKEVTRTGHLANHWTVGSALVWSPAFLLADLVRPSDTPRNGVALPYNLAIVCTSAVAGLVTLLAGHRVARCLTTPFAATTATIGAWLGTPLLWYALVHATMAHAVSAMCCALVFAGAVALRDDETPSRTTQLLTGLAAGLAFATRPQNAPVALVPLLLDRRALSWPYAAGLALGALPQLIVSTFLYGSPLGFLGGGEAKAFAAFERIWTWEPLLSWYHGLIPWSPFAALGLAGLVLLYRRDRKLALACLLLFVSQWLINATLERSFWGALAFGQRRFDNCTIVFLIGAAVLVERIGRAGAVVVAAASLWTMSLFFAARRGLDLVSYHRPGELLAQQIDALADLPAQLQLLGSVPPPLRGRVIAFVAVFFALFALLALLARRPRIAAIAACTYAGAASLFLFWCGMHGRPEQYRTLIERNRPLARTVAARHGLLQDELNYLVRSGRMEEAAETARELERLPR